MHIFFSGIGGSGLGPLALITKQAGYTVSGSDAEESSATKILRQQGIDLYIGQSAEAIATHHAKQPVDWFVVSSAIIRTNPDHPELVFAKQHGIHVSRRDELLSKIISDKNLRLIGISGTHGKSTTTAMAVWLFHRLGIPIGHSVGAKLPFAPMGQLQPGSDYFVYECDEFDNNFLAFHPHLALITGIAWDHHEIFPTAQSYKKAYQQFINQSQHTLIWQEDMQHLGLPPSPQLTVIDEHDPAIATISLPGEYNRQDAWQAVLAVHRLVGTPIPELIKHIDHFPGLRQRMEEIAPNLYSNYAHTPQKIRGGMLTALELAKPKNQNVVVIYEPLTNRRQHHIKEEYGDCFKGAQKLYWAPTYLAREDPGLALLTPAELVTYITEPKNAKPVALDDELLGIIKAHLARGDMVVAMGASGSDSLDEWLRKHFEERS